MGGAQCTNQNGRPVGYAVEAMCDQPGCSAKIDRGLYFVCGGMHDGGEHGCGGYFCGEHLCLDLSPGGAREQLCQQCLEELSDERAA